MAPAADREGYWGPPTSTLEWCEENYAVSYYIAEFCEWPLRPRLLPRPRGPRPTAASFSLSAALRALSPLLLPGHSFLRGDGAAAPQPTLVGGNGCFLPPSPTNSCRGGVAPLSPACCLGPHPKCVSLACVHRDGGAGAGVPGACGVAEMGWPVRWVPGLSRELGWLCGITDMGEERGFLWSPAWGATP